MPSLSSLPIQLTTYDFCDHFECLHRRLTYRPPNLHYDISYRLSTTSIHHHSILLHLSRPSLVHYHLELLLLNPTFALCRAKSKNSSQHNQVRKAHRNGIKKPKTNKYPSLRGVDPKFVRNQRYAKHGTEKALKAARAEA